MSRALALNDVALGGGRRGLHHAKLRARHHLRNVHGRLRVQRDRARLHPGPARRQRHEYDQLVLQVLVDAAAKGQVAQQHFGGVRADLLGLDAFPAQGRAGQAAAGRGLGHDDDARAVADDRVFRFLQMKCIYQSKRW